ncbi:MAG: hypothetical protein EBQ66_02720 [Flavobacteriia bacterium]|nr:hypothetical protein [Flavobacteriia bacterium]NBY39831.1 hypothetical protein [Flavobacteriia bacterium]
MNLPCNETPLLLQVISSINTIPKGMNIPRNLKLMYSPFIFISHGWVYDVADGLIQDLEVTIKNDSSLSDVYKLDL